MRDVDEGFVERCIASVMSSGEGLIAADYRFDPIVSKNSASTRFPVLAICRGRGPPGRAPAPLRARYSTDLAHGLLGIQPQLPLRVFFMGSTAAVLCRHGVSVRAAGTGRLGAMWPCGRRGRFDLLLRAGAQHHYLPGRVVAQPADIVGREPWCVFGGRGDHDPIEAVSCDGMSERVTVGTASLDTSIDGHAEPGRALFDGLLHGEADFRLLGKGRLERQVQGYPREEHWYECGLLGCASRRAASSALGDSASATNGNRIRRWPSARTCDCARVLLLKYAVAKVTVLVARTTIARSGQPS